MENAQARSKELSHHTVLPPERVEVETQHSVYLQRKQANAHRASECFDLN